MIVPQKQALRHDPENGVHGDCLRTAVAMLMGLNARDLPHFADVGVSDHVAPLREYLAAQGHGLMQFIYPPETEIKTILHTLAYLSPGVPFMLSGKSPRGDWGHAVVAIDGQIADPATGDWVTNPENALHGAHGEWWWVEAIIALPRNEARS
ncbi:hypothetical protein ACSSNL_04435 [Thalassobius sp. S69A]|uniref:hypothetical protein n=1 Tax=unclassified Thalassovita TaxID=2619711 RepID=UPI003C7A857E